MSRTEAVPTRNDQREECAEAQPHAAGTEALAEAQPHAAGTGAADPGTPTTEAPTANRGTPGETGHSGGSGVASFPGGPGTPGEAGDPAEASDPGGPGGPGDPALPRESAASGEAEAEAGESAEARPAWLRLPVLLLAAALVLAGAGAWFTLEARSASAHPAAANLALTDVGATADVTSAVTLAVNRIFSYSYDRTDVTEKAAAAVLRGSAKDSYDRLFAQVREKAPQQKLVLTSRVSAIAVQDLRNGHARLLVFLDQSAVRADNNATDSAAAQLSVTAEHTGDGWVITGLEPR